jgi:cytochrome P450
MARKENNVDETTFAANTPVDSPTHDHTNTYFGNNQLRPLPLLDRIIRQEEREGKGISQATMTEVSILLWMVMDAGNAWTAMALNLISSNEEALVMVQDELDYLVQIYGREQLFTPIVLARMKHLDALLFEAIRLCPPFLGGMKVTQETVVFEELDLQVPKNCNVFFCQPTNENFDLANAVGKRPEMLGFQYPCVEL